MRKWKRRDEIIVGEIEIKKEIIGKFAAMKERVAEKLSGRLRINDISALCAECMDNDSAKGALFSMINNPDDRIGYNALWVFTLFSARDIKWLLARRDSLISSLLETTHVGKKRLLLTLLERLPDDSGEFRTDYLDFCLSEINSNEPYAIRALSLKQAFSLCRHYPELTAELETEISLMDQAQLSPGLLSARKNILKKIARTTSSGKG